MMWLDQDWAPVTLLTMCMSNATAQADPASNRKLNKIRSRARIDGAVALAMAMAVAGTWEPLPPFDVLAMIA
jgi:hypothetical protein